MYVYICHMCACVHVFADSFLVNSAAWIQMRDFYEEGVAALAVSWERHCRHGGNRETILEVVREETGSEGRQVASLVKQRRWGCSERRLVEKAVNSAPRPVQPISARVGRCHCRQLPRKSESCWAPTGKHLQCVEEIMLHKAISAGGGAFYLAISILIRKQMYVNIRTGIFLKLTGSQQRSKQHTLL